MCINIKVQINEHLRVGWENIGVIIQNGRQNSSILQKRIYWPYVLLKIEIEPLNMATYSLLTIIKHICIIPCFKSNMATTIRAKMAPKIGEIVEKVKILAIDIN